MKVAEIEQCNRSHNVVTIYLHQSYVVLSIVLFGLLSLSLFYCMGKKVKGNWSPFITFASKW